jgi:cobalamin biosynthesis Mg chelatase CobN
MRPEASRLSAAFRRVAALGFRYALDVRTATVIALPAVRRQLRQLASTAQAKALARFFKTAPGEYGAGDRFLGLRVADVRRLIPRT